MENKITSGLEDYLEYIYLEVSGNKKLRAVDIANHFNFSRSTVSEALIKLVDLELIVYEARQGVKITQKGIVEAKKIIEKHKVLTEFFNKVLGIDLEISSKNACRIEHVIDDEVVKKIKIFCEEQIGEELNRWWLKK